MTQAITFIFFLAALAFFVSAALYVPRFVYVYRISNRGILVKLLGLVTLHRIWWTEIVDVRVVPLWDSPVYYSIPAYIFSKKRVVVRLRKGLFRNVVLSPKDPDRFAREVLDRVTRVQGVPQHHE